MTKFSPCHFNEALQMAKVSNSRTNDKVLFIQLHLYKIDIKKLISAAVNFQQRHRIPEKVFKK